MEERFFTKRKCSSTPFPMGGGNNRKWNIFRHDKALPTHLRLRLILHECKKPHANWRKFFRAQSRLLALRFKRSVEIGRVRKLNGLKDIPPPHIRIRTRSSNQAEGGRGEEEAEHQNVGPALPSQESPEAGDKNTVSNGLVRSRRLSTQ